MTQRVIKFRAWHNEAKAMLQVGDNHGTTHPLDCALYARHGQDVVLMLWTGLLDKHGKEIYEGDIFEYEAWHGGPEHAMLEKSLKEQGKPLPSYKERRVILSHPYGHFITRKLDDITDMTYTGDTFYHTPATTAAWEIIGNIYTTPELVDPKMIER